MNGPSEYIDVADTRKVTISRKTGTEPLGLELANIDEGEIGAQVIKVHAGGVAETVSGVSFTALPCSSRILRPLE